MLSGDRSKVKMYSVSVSLFCIVVFNEIIFNDGNL